MTVQSGLVPLLDEHTGRFPDEFAPPSVAADATAAQDAAEAASRAQEAAEAAENNAAGHKREAGQIVEDATATIPGLISEQVTAQIDPKVATATQAKNDAETARGAAQTARDDALQAKAQAVAAQEAAAGSAGAAATSAGSAADSAQSATQAKDAAETARDKAIQAAADAIGALPEFDAAAGEYDPAGLAAWMLRKRDGQIYGVQRPGDHLHQDRSQRRYRQSDTRGDRHPGDRPLPGPRPLLLPRGQRVCHTGRRAARDRLRWRCNILPDRQQRRRVDSRAEPVLAVLLRRG